MGPDIKLTQEEAVLLILEKVTRIQEHTAPSELVLWRGADGWPNTNYRYPLPGGGHIYIEQRFTEKALIIRVLSIDGSVYSEFTQPVRWCE